MSRPVKKFRQLRQQRRDPQLQLQTAQREACCCYETVRELVFFPFYYNLLCNTKGLLQGEKQAVHQADIGATLDVNNSPIKRENEELFPR